MQEEKEEAGGKGEEEGVEKEDGILASVLASGVLTAILDPDAVRSMAI
jgi:hypothetical protein